MKLFVFMIVFIATTWAVNLPREPRRVSTFGNLKLGSHSQNKYINKGKSAYSSSINSYGDEQILRNDQVMMKNGAYRYDYETSNGIQGNEEGIGGVSVQGSNSYISPEGVEVKMSYTADETGYHPVGEHIPQIPDYILRALEYIRTHPPKDRDNNFNGSKQHNFRGASSTPKLSTSIVPPHKSASLRNTKNRFSG